MKQIFSLRNLAFLSIVAVPLYSIKVSFFGIPTNVFELLACITTMLFLYRAVSLKIELSGYRKYYMPIVLLLTGLILSTLYNKDYRVGFGVIKSWFIIPMLFSWACAQIFIDKKDILKAVYISSFLVACISAVYFLSGDVTFDGRLQAFYNSPNFLAMYLAPAVIIGFFLFNEDVKPYAASLSIIVISIYLTKSYAAWTAIFISMVLVAFMKKKMLDRKKAAGLILIFGMFFFLQKDTEKFSSLVGMKDRSSISSRMMIWSSAWRMASDSPIFGIGPGNFQNKYLEYQKYFPPYLEWAVPQPHNLFLAFWLQSGAIGIIGFACLIFIWARSLVGAGGTKRNDYIYLGIIMYIIVHGLVDTTYFKNDLAVIFWLIIFSIKKRSSIEERSVPVFL